MDDMFRLKEEGQYLIHGYNKNIVEVVIPDGVRVLWNYAFEGCKSLRSVTIPQSVTNILEYAFANCYSLNTIILPQNLEELGRCAFLNCKSLQSIVIPDNTINFGYDIFEGCSSLCHVKLPNGINELNGSFCGCSSLEDIDIPDSVEIIETCCFYSCKSLKAVDIPKNVKHIGDFVFSDCKSLESVDIPSSVTTIGVQAFSNCTSLKSIFIHDKMREIGRCAFKGTNVVIHVDSKNPHFFVKDDVLYERLENGNNLLHRYYPLKDDKIFTIDDSVSIIGCAAFYEAANLEEIYFPKCESLSLESSLFKKCTRIKAIHVFWRSLDNISTDNHAFDYFDIDNCTLYVPSGSKWIYRNHPIFGKFKNIEIEL